MKMRNSVQLRDDPWGKPSSSVLCGDVAPLYCVRIVLFCKKALIQEYIFPCTHKVSHPHEQSLPPDSVIRLLQINKNSSGVLLVLESVYGVLHKSEKLIVSPTAFSKTCLMIVQDSHFL